VAENSARSLIAVSKPMGNSMMVDCIEFSDVASMQNFLEHLERNNCEDYDLEKIRNIIKRRRDET
jgi:hypothetical protein